MVELQINVPKNYLEEEVRCGHIITKQTKELWAVELDLLNQFDIVCKKYQLRYVADAGTLLGAIRHHGFIPWDDDIDVGMPRADYEKFIEIGQEEFKYPYYLESFQSEPTFVYDKAKLLNLQTTGYENPFLNKHAIFLDIFPYDNIVDDESLLKAQGQELLRIFAKFQRTVTCSYKWYYQDDNVSFVRKLARWLEHYRLKFSKMSVGSDYQKSLFMKMQETTKRYNTKLTTNVGALAEFQTNVVDIISKEDFDHLYEVDFEFLKIPVPPHYDQVLTRLYGDYHTFVKGGSVHTFKIIDTNRPYTEVLKEKGIINE